MIWFNIKRLERQYVVGDVSGKEGFKYLLANMVMFSLAPYLTGEGYENYWLTFIQFIVDMFITVMVVKTTFDINENGDKRDYFKRFLGLSFVTSIRLIVYIACLYLPTSIIMLLVDKTGSVDKNIKDLFFLILSIISVVAYYFMLTKSFRLVNDKRELKHEQ